MQTVFFAAMIVVYRVPMSYANLQKTSAPPQKGARELSVTGFGLAFGFHQFFHHTAVF